MDKDANLLFQVLLLRGLSIEHLSEDRPYVNAQSQQTLKTTLDPLSMETLIRAQFEAYCMLHNIFLRPTKPEERELLYELWVISGLKERQRFAGTIIDPVNFEKSIDDLEEIWKRMDALSSSAYFQSLSDESKTVVIVALQKRQNQLLVEGSEVRSVGWRDLFSRAGAKEGMEIMYAMLSLAAHPSNVSVFQFRDMYASDAFRVVTVQALRNSSLLMAFAVRDFVKLFPALELTVNGWKNEHQLLINDLNVGFRGASFRLNDIRNHLGLPVL